MTSQKEFLKILENPELIKQELARRDFLEYRKYLDPKLKVGWWVKETSRELQQFHDDLKGGKKPILVIEAPPQHGKSVAIIDFISWLAGHNPDLKTVYTSFSERLGIRANLKLQRIYDSERYKAIFPDTRINSSNVVTISGQYLRNREILEYVGRDGYFRNTTVRGQITGESLDLGVIDDPIKGREEANSLTVREKTWEWLTDDLFTRFSENAALLCILTRWHIDDPIGRLKDHMKSVKTLSYKAIADDDEEHRKAGEVLFPEHKSLEFLLKRKDLMTESNWMALYQQNPIISGGGMMRIGKIEIVAIAPNDITKRVRYWDKAGTKDGGAYTAGVLIGKTKDNLFYVEDVVRGQWSALERENIIKQTAQVDGTSVEVWIEQEPGSGGLESADNTIRNLSGFTVKKEKVTGDKVTRSEPYAAQLEAGNIKLIKAEWNRTFIAEHESFPHGKYKDQVDAVAGGFNKLASTVRYGFTEKQMRDNMKREKTMDAPDVDEVVW